MYTISFFGPSRQTPSEIHIQPRKITKLTNNQQHDCITCYTSCIYDLLARCGKQTNKNKQTLSQKTNVSLFQTVPASLSSPATVCSCLGAELSVFLSAERLNGSFVCCTHSPSQSKIEPDKKTGRAKSEECCN